MKYAVFWASLSGVPFLAWFLSLKLQWIRWAIFGMIVGIYAYQPTAINFLSYEWYTGTSRGMEISLIHILALAVLLALAFRGKWQRLFPEGGIVIYAVYFLLCLPSLRQADNILFGWLEIWKMMLLFLFWHAVYGYLAATGDVGTVVKALAVFTIASFLEVARQHYAGVFQPGGVFPHRNCMSMAMNLLGPVFFAGYLQLGLKDWLGRLCAGAFAGAAVGGMWSYSRGAIAMIPVGYGLAALGCLVHVRPLGRMALRMAPVALAGAVGLVAIWPNLVGRFENASPASKETRKNMAYCTVEMIKAHPWTGVGINNLSLNMDETHPYRDRASEAQGREVFAEGIVETVYLLVGAECGIPALLAMLAWFGWYWLACAKLAWRLRGTKWHFVAAGLCGGLAANYLQSTLEWVLRQQMNLFLLVFCFALAAYLRKWKPSPEDRRAPA